jgi:hypothetical protein
VNPQNHVVVDSLEVISGLGGLRIFYGGTILKVNQAIWHRSHKITTTFEISTGQIAKTITRPHILKKEMDLALYGYS